MVNNASQLLYLQMTNSKPSDISTDRHLIPDEVSEFNGILQNLHHNNKNQKERHVAKGKLLAKQRIDL